jgi:hypothetical protein
MGSHLILKCGGKNFAPEIQQIARMVKKIGDKHHKTLDAMGN